MNQNLDILGFSKKFPTSIPITSTLRVPSSSGLSISDNLIRLLEYFMDGLPRDNGALGFFKPLLWAAAGDTSLNVRFL